MEKLIPLINKLQDALGTMNSKVDIQLPQIVVVGSQSSGKSSVLESIVGKDFLPRGSGIVTRRPLVLQLIQTQVKEEYGIFGHRPEKYTDFSKIRQEIEEETERKVGKNANISNESIFLKVYSPHVLDVTLVDLPGLTKVPVGDQPMDIEFQIREMISSFIKNENSIILAVSNANVDLANSESLKLAKEFDPQGERTFGVLTKIDLMDKGTNAVEMLKGKVYPLKLGYVGVVCRSQEDINMGKPIWKHLEDEKNFFLHHVEYKSMASKLGIPFLTMRLNNVLMNHIKKVLPDLKIQINDKIRKNEEQLKTYGMPLDGNEHLQGILMLNIITNFSNSFNNIIEGRAIQDNTENSDNFNYTETSANQDQKLSLEGGAMIREILLETFIEKLKLIEALDTHHEDQISEAITSASGVKTNFYVSEAAFELLLKIEIKRLVEPSISVMNDVYDQLRNIANEISIPEAERFPNLKEAINGIVFKVLYDCLGPTEEFIKNFLEIQQAYINTSLVEKSILNDFMTKAEEEADKAMNARSSINSLGSPKSKIVFTSHSDVDEEEKSKLIEVYTIKHLVKYFFDQIKKLTGDYVPKAVMSLLVIKAKETIQNELITQLYSKSKFEELFFENSDVPYKRRALNEIQLSLTTASRILSEARDFKIEE
jgi:dynamin 1-like protein